MPAKKNTNEGRGNPKWIIHRRLLVYTCFFLSGAAGLIYEVVWSRQLGLFLGITSHATTAVITAYMLGLAAGSWWIGRRADSVRQPLRLYAWLEIGIGIFAASTPWLFKALQAGYAGWTGEIGVAGPTADAIRFVIALAAMLPPTFLMGGTLPLLVRGLLQESPQLGAITGRLYGINTLGAMVGTAIAGFWLLPWIGVTRSIMTGVAANLFVALLVLLFAAKPAKPAAAAAKAPTPKRKGGSRVPPSPATLSPAALTPAAVMPTAVTPTALRPAQGFALLAGFAIAGFAALLTQLAWIRAMVLVVGGSVYAFTITLTSFLAGIGLGSLVYGAWLSRKGNSVEARFRLAALLAFLIALTGLLSLALIGQLPSWFLAGYEAGWVQKFTVYQVFIFALCFAVMFLPTLFMGALFPLLAVSWTGPVEKAGRGIGGAYAVNTAGTILGCLLGGLLLLPVLGIHYSIVLSASLYAVVAAGLALSAGSAKPIVTAIGVAIFIIAAWLTPEWNRERMASGVFYQTELKANAKRSPELQRALDQQKLVYYKEGLHGTVSVTDDGRQKSLVVNGKAEASSVSDRSTQISLAQLGTLMHPQPRSALVIGLGSGVTAGSLTTHDSIEEITVLEISHEVVEASEFFTEENHDVLSHPAVNLVAADGRNYVLASDRKWDLIISEPSNPWLSGVSNLFTEDFFRLIKKRLAPGGVMTQWFHLYGVSVDDVKTVLQGFAANYRHVIVWHLQAGDLIMTGSDDVQALDMGRLETAFADPRIGPELLRAGFSTPRDLLLHFLMDGQRLSEYVAGAKPDTDDRPNIEFSAPRSMYARGTQSVLEDIVNSAQNYRYHLPLANPAMRTDAGFRSRTLNLEVSSRPGTDFEKVQSDWQLWRVVQPGQSGSTVGVADYRQMSWLEEKNLVNVQLVRDTFSPNPSQRQSYLAANLKIPPVAGGILGRAGDPDAVWLSGTDTVEQSTELGLFWTCPQDDGASNWYIVTARLEGLVDTDPFTLATTFGDRFRCD